MDTEKTPENALQETKISVQIKLAPLWTSLMFLIIYLDYFALYMPGTITNILKGSVFVFNISQVFLLIALSIVAIPTMMIFLSVSVPAKVNRLTNIIVATLNIPCLLFNLAGEAWIHMVFGVVLEVVLLCLIIRYAWKWPRVESYDDYIIFDK